MSVPKQDRPEQDVPAARKPGPGGEQTHPGPAGGTMHKVDEKTQEQAAGEREKAGGYD